MRPDVGQGCPETEIGIGQDLEQADRQRPRLRTRKPRAGETNAEIRKVWMWGNVALAPRPQKDKDKDKSAGRSDQKGMEASGEALYLDNRGTNKAITYVYQRDPTEKTYLPGPLPPARVENSEDNDPKRSQPRV